MHKIGKYNYQKLFGIITRKRSSGAKDYGENPQPGGPDVDGSGHRPPSLRGQ